MNPLLPCVLLGTLTPAQAPLRSPAAVAAAERAFAALAGRVGTPEAFLATLTEDAVVFTPKAENGHAAQRAQPKDESRLSWAPEHVEVAASGDFALSTGPWDWRPKPGAEPAARGHFLSLWVLRGTRWKVLLDVGAPHPAQAALPLETRALEATPDPGARASLAAAWKDFDLAAVTDPSAALKTWAAADLRLYRKGHPLKAGLLPEAPGAGATFREEGTHLAASVDLALRWGLREGGTDRSSAVQVWRREGRTWRVAMDVELPLPPAKP
ncbi:MAG TPA: nuclear transport factor 2 family protein [Holophagaceae bacterium]|nr:nuclear transport factor 2 family protein [Holophagaceae bacterium]